MHGSPISKFFDLCEQEYSSKNDCCTVVADCVFENYGKDIFSKWRGKYKTERDFVRLLKENKYKNFVDGFNKTMKLEGLISGSEPKDFSVGLIQFMDTKLRLCPAFYYNGLWHGRTNLGSIIARDGANIWQ